MPENTTEDPFINQQSNLPQLVVRLQGEKIVDEQVFGNHFVGGTYKAELNYMKDWLQQRLFWMDTELAGW